MPARPVEGTSTGSNLDQNGEDDKFYEAPEEVSESTINGLRSRRKRPVQGSSSTAQLLDHGKVHIEGSEVHNTAVSYHLSTPNVQIKLDQPESRGGYLKNAELRWNGHIPEEYYVEQISVKFEQDNKTIFKKLQNWEAWSYKLPSDKFKCDSSIKISFVVTFTKEGQRSISDIQTFRTKPSQPQIKHEIQNNVLKVSWLAIDRCTSYWLKLEEEHGFGSRSDAWTLNETSREFIIGKDVDWGDNITVEVTATCTDNLNNSAKEKIFVGDKSRVPRNVTATLSSDNRTISCKWKKAEKEPKYYEVCAVLNGVDQQTRTVKGAVTDKIPDVKQGSNYTIKVRAVYNDPGKYVKSNSVDVEAADDSEPVVIVDARPADKDPAAVITVSWQSQDNALGYKIECRDTFNGYYYEIRVDDGAITEKDISGLEPCSEYKITIRAKNSSGSYGKAGEECKVSTGLGSVTGATITSNGNSVQVNFSRVKKATSYIIQLFTTTKSESSMVKEIYNESATCHNIPGLGYNAQYYAEIWALRRCNEENHQGKSVKTVSVWTVPGPMPAPRVEYSAVYPPNNGGITSYDELQRKLERNLILINWDRVNNVTGFQIKISRGTSNFYIIDHNGENPVTISEFLQCYSAEYGISIRGKNRAGYGQWSPPTAVNSVPNKIEGFTCKLMPCMSKIEATWSKERSFFQKALVEYWSRDTMLLVPGIKPVTVMVEKERAELPIDKLRPGSAYFLSFTCQNDERSGLPSFSKDIFIPLDPPKRCEVCDTPGKGKRVKIEPSLGMTDARIMVNLGNFTINEPFIKENEKTWSCTLSVLPPGKRLTYQILPGNGDTFGPSFLSGYFITTPPPIREINAMRDKYEPETCILVYTDAPPVNMTIIIVAECDGEKPVTETIRDSNFVKLIGLKPATRYMIYGQKEFEEKLSEKVHARPIITAFPKVKGLKSSQKNGVGNILLQWDNADEGRCEYTVRHIFENKPPIARNTKECLSMFRCLPSGYHAFTVQAEDGAVSDVHEIYIPHQLRVNRCVSLSSRQLVIDCLKLPDTTSTCYKFEIRKAFDGALILSSKDMQLPELTFDGDYSTEYEVTAVAYWKKDGQYYYGDAVTIACKTEHNIFEIASMIQARRQNLAQKWLKSNVSEFVPLDIDEIQEDGSTRQISYSKFMEQAGGHKCVLLGEAGKTTLLEKYVVQFEVSKIDPSLILDYSEFKECTLENHLGDLSRLLGLTSNEKKKLSEYVTLHPKNVTVIFDCTTDSHDSAYENSVKNFEKFISELPTATVVTAYSTGVFCNDIQATKAGWIRKFENDNVRLVAAKALPTEVTKEVIKVLDDFPLINEIARELKYCIPTLEVILETLRGKNDVDFYSDSSFVTAVLLKSISTKFGINRKAQEKLIKLSQNYPPDRGVVGPYFKAWRNLTTGEFVTYQNDKKVDKYTKETKIFQDANSFKLACGLLRESTLSDAERLFRRKVKNAKNIKDSLSHETKDGPRKDIASVELTKPFQQLRINIDNKKEEIPENFSGSPVSRRYVVACGCPSEHKRQDLKKVVEKLPFEKLCLIDIKNMHHYTQDVSEWLYPLMKRAERIRIVNSKLQAKAIDGICEEIQQMDGMFCLYELNFNGNKLVKDCLSSIDSCGPKVMAISLRDCGLTESKITEFQNLHEKYKKGFLFL